MKKMALVEPRLLEALQRAVTHKPHDVAVPCQPTRQGVTIVRSGDGSDITTIDPVGHGENSTVPSDISAFFDLSQSTPLDQPTLLGTPVTVLQPSKTVYSPSKPKC